ncbi:MAG: hypothetical protein KFW07_02635, partial [Mycoplasmataceae bacterium]|nr:hypothetical protein [Mycoplasmataceae bacterium]
PLVKNQYVKYGFDKDFVGYSPSTLIGVNAALVNKLLQDAFTLFNTSKPKFENMTISGQNQRILDELITKINS